MFDGQQAREGGAVGWITPTVTSNKAGGGPDSKAVVGGRCSMIANDERYRRKAPEPRSRLQSATAGSGYFVRRQVWGDTLGIGDLIPSYLPSASVGPVELMSEGSPLASYPKLYKGRLEM